VNFQSLQKGSTIVVPLKSLGGYEVDIFVEECEPGNEVLLRGDVVLELVAPIEDVVEWSGPKTTTAIPPKEDGGDDFSQMFPVDSVATEIAQKKFVAFSGIGYKMT
jgi:hypothetical protein